MMRLAVTEKRAPQGAEDKSKQAGQSASGTI